MGPVTARVTTLKGADAGAYYVEALPSYYLDSGEPRGRWVGRCAELLGLDGEVVDREFLRVMAGLQPRVRGEVPLGRSFGEGSVRGFDVTASAPKSVSTLFALGDAETRATVLDAHDAAVAAVIDWVEAHAHTRYRIGGEVAVVDAQGIVAATFRQHTSRALDPQLHTHVVIANRVRSPDGRWLALDARSLKTDQRTLSSIYHLALRSRLSARLGVEWEPVVNGIAEVAHADGGVLEEFSTRTAQIQRRVDVKLDRFADSMGREPTRRERWRLEREAVVDSRPAKSEHVDGAGLHRGWVERVTDLGQNPERVVGAMTGGSRCRLLDSAAADRAIVDAVAVLSEKQSSWRPAEVSREIAAAIPTTSVVRSEDLGRVLESLTQEAIERLCVDISRPIRDGVGLRSDGRPVTESATDRALTTPEILAQENRLLGWAERHMAREGVDSPAAVDRAEVSLTGPQAEVAAAVAGDGDLVVVVGPAGTGKTTALAPAVEQLRVEGRAVFGVAPSATAADVLGSEAGVDADTIDKLLTEHSLDRPPEHRYDLPAAATVIVDEAGMVATDRLDALAELADSRGWRVVLVGDPMQFAAVGRGGMFEHLIGTHGAIELDQVHRFSNDWERDASLRLRRGDPSVAGLYNTHGRLHGGTARRMQQQALDAWAECRSRGETVLLCAPTNETVTQINTTAQQKRIIIGEIDTNGRHVDASGYRLWVGDEIVTRRNHRQLHTDQGLMIRNRDQWTITQVHRNGDLTVGGRTGSVRLPADYVGDHVELAYAQTSHATQGRTVDRSILLLDSPSDVRGVYVPMTRGRLSNDAYIVTDSEQTGADVFADSISRSWIDRPAIARQAELASLDPHRPGTLTGDELRSLFDEQAQITGTLDRLRSDLEFLPCDRNREQRELTEQIEYLQDTRDRIRRAHDTIAARDRPFRRRGHEEAITNAKATIEAGPEDIAEQTIRIGEIEARLARIDRRLHNAHQIDRPALEARLSDITERLSEDRQIRREQARHAPGEHIINEIGARSTRPRAGKRWDSAAARLDQHDTAYRRHGQHQSGPGFEHSLNLTRSAVAALTQALNRARGIDSPDYGIGR